MSVNDAAAAPVFVESVAISTEITSQFAVTTYELTFRNPNDRVLEGAFEFPLLDGQTVIRFALDINGMLREAVPVAKERGRIVFEEIQRRRVDPGLLEQTAGNNYRARVFPLPAHGTRRIAIAYQEPLGRADSGLATYRLALAFPEKLSSLAMRIQVHGDGAGEPPRVQSTLPFAWPGWDARRCFAVEVRDVPAVGVFEVELPPLHAPALLTQRWGERDYFYAEVPVPDFKPRARPAPKVLGLLWDASGSARHVEREKLQQFLDQWFRTVGDVEVRVQLLRDTASPGGTFAVRNGNWSGLRRALQRLAYDGATGFDGIVDDPAVDEWLLVSDGLVNYGSADRASLPVAAPVHVVVAHASADTPRLRALADRHRGEFANLVDTPALAAVRRLRAHAPRVLSVGREPADFAEVFPEVGTAVDGSVLAVCGVIRAETATVRVHVGHDEADARWIEVPVARGEGASTLAARAWAGTKLKALAGNVAENRQDIRRTSEEFGIVTAETSLIVLETLADYMRYGIVPPAELRPAWDAWSNRRMLAQRDSRERHTDYIVRAFAERQRWWKHDFDTPYQPHVVASDWRAAPAGPAPADAPETDRSEWDQPTRIELADDGSGEEIVVLSPFMVEASSDMGYTAASTLAGSRLRTGGRRLSRGEGRGAVSRPTDGSTPDGDTLQPWSPRGGYIDRINRAVEPERYAVYLEERRDHARDAGFFLEVADYFFEMNQPALARRILSNLAELQLEDPALLRVLAYRLMQAGHPELARPLLEHVLRIRGEDPQSRRDLAFACAALRDYQRAVDLLWEVVETPWDGRFTDIGLIALGELNAIVATCGRDLDLSGIDPRLRANLAVGLRIVVTWDADNCDVDLWINDPHGERARYDHPFTRQGGRLSRDFIGGFGPEEFLLRSPAPGRYDIRINFYGDERNIGLGPVTVQVKVVTGFGTPAEEEQLFTVRLDESRRTLKVATIEIPGDGQEVTSLERPLALRRRK